MAGFPVCFSINNNNTHTQTHTFYYKNNHFKYEWDKWIRHAFFLLLGRKNTVLNSFYGFSGKMRATLLLITENVNQPSILQSTLASKTGFCWSPQTLGLQLSPTQPQLQRSLRGHQFIPCPPGRPAFQPYLNDHCPPLLAFQITKLPVLVQKNDVQILCYRYLIK